MFYGNTLIKRFGETRFFTEITSLNNSYCESSGIEYFVFPPNVKSTGYNVLRTCKSLKGVEIGASVTGLGGCFCFQSPNIEWVRCMAVTPPSQGVWGGQYSFYPKSTANSSYYKLRLYVPDESVETYKAAAYWDGFASRTFPMSQFDADAEQYGWDGY